MARVDQTGAIHTEKERQDKVHASYKSMNNHIKALKSAENSHAIIVSREDELTNIINSINNISTEADKTVAIAALNAAAAIVEVRAEYVKRKAYLAGHVNSNRVNISNVETTVLADNDFTQTEKDIISAAKTNETAIQG